MLESDSYLKGETVGEENLMGTRREQLAELSAVTRFFRKFSANLPTAQPLCSVKLLPFRACLGPGFFLPTSVRFRFRHTVF